MEKAERRYDIDWLRVLAVLAVFFFHSSRFFTNPPWHIRNAEFSEVAEILAMFVSQWGMPLIFVISGASIFFALHPGKARDFLTSKVLRLLVPLLFGIVILAPLQRYMERLAYQQFEGSFWQFLPRAFDRYNFDIWGIHLYYLAALFIYSIVFLPLFVYLKGNRGQQTLTRMGGFLARPGMIFILVIPLALALITFDPEGFLGDRSHGGWSLWIYPFFLIYGFLVFSDLRIQQTIIRQRWFTLALGLVLTTILAVMAASTDVGNLGYGTPRFILLMALDGLFAWTMILVILGFGMRHLNFTNRFLPYANEAVLPFYILHQPVILAIGFFIIPLALPIPVKYLIIAPTALIVTVGIYELIIRRVNFLRPLLGLKPVKKVAPDKALPPQPAD